MRAEIAELKEAQRWRKYSEEKPSSDGYYIICGASGFRNADRFMECKDGRGMDFSFYSYGVEYWMPMPSAPQGAVMRADAKVERLTHDKDKEIAGLKQKLDDVQARLYAESVDTWIRERRLQRALWVTRAERAIEKQNHFALCHNNSIDRYLCINGASMPTERNTTMRQPREWSMIWKKVAIKCRAKAEQYK